MEYNKSTVMPSKHIIEIEYGGIKMRFYNQKALGFSVSIRKAAKGETT